MRSIATGVTCAAAVCVLTGTVQAAGGVFIVEKTTTGGSPQTTQIQIEGKQVLPGAGRGRQ
jgi:hypothetical protein